MARPRTISPDLAPPKNPALTQDRMKVVIAKPAIPTGTGSAMAGLRAAGTAAGSAPALAEMSCADMGCSLHTGTKRISSIVQRYKAAGGPLGGPGCAGAENARREASCHEASSHARSVLRMPGPRRRGPGPVTRPSPRCELAGQRLTVGP